MNRNKNWFTSLIIPHLENTSTICKTFPSYFSDPLIKMESWFDGKKKSPCIRAKLKKLFFTEEKKQFLKAKKTNYLLNSDIIRQTSDINMCIDLQLKPTVWWFICFLQGKKKKKERSKNKSEITTANIREIETIN